MREYDRPLHACVRRSPNDFEFRFPCAPITAQTRGIANAPCWADISLMPTLDPEAVTIRAATPADLSTLGRLAALLVRTHHDFDHARFIAATSQTARGYALYFGSQIGQSNTVVVVAVHEGRAIGYAWGSLEGVDCMVVRRSRAKSRGSPRRLRRPSIGPATGRATGKATNRRCLRWRKSITL